MKDNKLPKLPLLFVSTIALVALLFLGVRAKAQIGGFPTPPAKAVIGGVNGPVPNLYTNLPWTAITNSQTDTFPLTNGPIVSVPPGIGFGGIANSNWITSQAFTNGWTAMAMGRGMAVWVGICPTNSTATNTVVTGWTVSTGNGTVTDAYANNTILVTNTVNAAGTNVSVSYLGPLSIDNVSFAKLSSVQLIQTNSSIQIAVWTSIVKPPALQPVDIR